MPGTNILSIINLTVSIIQLITVISTILDKGSSAVIMKKMGEYKMEETKEDFTLLILGIFIDETLFVRTENNYVFFKMQFSILSIF